MSSLGERIKTARERRGLNQADLARLCGVKTSTAISNWETDSSKPDVDKLVKLCIALDTSPETLLDYYPEDSEQLCTEAEDIAKDYLTLDESGRSIIREEIENQKALMENRARGYSAVDIFKIDKPIWLAKSDPDYLLMKAKARDLKKLKEATYKDTEEITRFLWSIGYEEGISRGSVFGAIELGTRVPNRQLYNRIEAFLQGRYHIKIDGEGEEG